MQRRSYNDCRFQVNQCEFHPYQNPKELREFCRENNICFQVSTSTLKMLLAGIGSAGELMMIV